MVEETGGLPAGALGFRITGKLSRNLVTDKHRVRHGLSAFGWISPGELRVFDSDQLDRAVAWVSE